MNQEESFESILLTNLQNVTKQSNINPMFDAVKEYKEKIVPDIIKFLQIRKVILAASHPEILATIIQLLKKLSKETPEVFSDGNITITGPVLFKLIPLLPDIMPKEQISNDFLDVIKNLIWLIYFHNMSAFFCFFKDLLLFLQDLNEICTYFRLSSNFSSTNSSTSISVKCFLSFGKLLNDIDNNFPKELLLDTTSIDRLKIFYITTLNLVTSIIERASQFIPSPCTELWSVLLATLRSSIPDLVQEGLTCFKAAITHLEIPCVLVDSFVTNLISLLSQSDDNETEQQINRSLLGNVVEKLFLTLSSDTIGVVSFQFLPVVMQNIQTSRNSNLKISLCKVLYNWLPRYPLLANQLTTMPLPRLAERQVQNYFVECLIQAVKSQITNENSSKSNILNCTSPSNIPNANNVVFDENDNNSEYPKVKRRRLDFDTEKKSSPPLLRRLLLELAQISTTWSNSNTTIPSSEPRSISTPTLLHSVMTLDTVTRVCLAFVETIPITDLISKIHSFLLEFESILVRQKFHGAIVFESFYILVEMIGKLLRRFENTNTLSDLLEPITRLLLLPWSDHADITSCLTLKWPQRGTLISSKDEMNVTDSNEFCIHTSAASCVLRSIDSCLTQLNWLPFGQFLEQRKKALLFSLEDKRRSIQLSALRALPFFSQRTGLQHISDFREKLRELLKSSDSVTVELVRCLGYLSCLCASVTCLDTNSKYHEFHYVQVSTLSQDRSSLSTSVCNEMDDVYFVPVCKQCDAYPILINEPMMSSSSFSLCTSSLDKAAAINLLKWDDYKEVLDLLSSTRKTDVKIAILQSLQRIFRHCDCSLIELDSFLAKTEHLMTDSEQSVRIAFNHLIPVFTSRVLKFGQAGTELLMTFIRNIQKSKQALPRTDSDIQITLLGALGQLGTVVEGLPLMATLLTLIGELVHFDIFLRAAAYEQIKKIADARGKPIKKFLKERKFKKEIYDTILLKLLDSPQLVEEFSSALLDKDCNDFIRQYLHITLPRIIVKSSKETCCKLLEIIERRLNTSARALILDEKRDGGSRGRQKVLTNTITYLLRRRAIDAGLKVIGIYVPVSLSKLLSFCQSRVVHKLVLRLGDEKKKAKAKAALVLIATALDPQRSLADFLKESFLGIDDFLCHKKIMPDKQPLEKKLSALRSIGELIELIGPHLSNFHLKIIHTLKVAEKISPLLKAESCHVWYKLVTKLEPNVLGPILSHVVVHLLGFLNDYEDKILPIFTYLFIERNADLQPYYKEIPFMPDSPPSLKKITAAYEAASGVSNLSLSDTLRNLIRVCKHESWNVREMALNKLIRVMQEKRHLLDVMILQEDSNPIINTLVETLLEGCRDPHPIPKMSFGIALGELGAIDPGRIPAVVSSEYDYVGSLDKEVDQVAIELVRDYLVKAYRSANLGLTQDRTAYAIQEILRHWGCNEETINEYERNKNSDKNGVRYWAQFPPDVQAIIQPFLTSQYYVKLDRIVQHHGPIFRPSYSYSKWLAEWTTQLIVKSEVPVYQPCKFVMRDNVDAAHFLLPHLVLHTIRFGSDTDRQLIKDEINAVLSNSAFGESPSKADSDIVSEVTQMATQRIFTLLDSLHKWVENKKKLERDPKASRTTRSSHTKSESNTCNQSNVGQSKYQLVEQLLNDIPQHMMAIASFRCKAYARALLHYENHVRKVIKEGLAKDFKSAIVDDIALLQKIYAGIEEPDGLIGLCNLRNCVSLQEQIGEMEIQGRWHEALLGFDQLIQNNPRDNFNLYLGRLRCLKNLGRLEEVLDLVKSALVDPELRHINTNPRHCGLLRAHGVSAAWRLGKWETVERFLENPCESDFEVQIAKILLAMKKRDDKEVRAQLKQARADIMTPLSAASLESYERAYPFVTKLHMLTELEHSWDILSKQPGEISPELKTKILSEWESRLKITQQSYKIREAILNLRQAICGLYLKSEVGKGWLKLAKTARQAKQSEACCYALLKASETKPQYYALERAKFLWDQGRQHLALLELQQEVQKQPLLEPKELSSISSIGVTESEDNSEKELPPNDISFAKSLLQIAKWSQHTGQFNHKQIIQQYETVTNYMKRWEKGYFHFARYYDHLVQEFKKETIKSSGDEHFIHSEIGFKEGHFSYLPHVLTNYGLALICGHQYIYQSMPRLLTLWLEAGTYAVSKRTKTGTKTEASQKSILQHNLPKLNKIMSNIVKKLPEYQWLICLPQIVGRVCHRNEFTWSLIKEIILKVLQKYPHQTIWYLVSLYKSTVKKRLERYTLIKEEARKKQEQLGKLMDDAENLCQQLLDLCYYPITDKKTTVLRMRRQFPKLINGAPYLQIIPIQSQLTFTLPASGKPNPKHHPFPEPLITIHSFNDEVQIMHSLQKPRKVEIIGSDSKPYLFLCKPKDDLRKDSRMMEFNTVINKLLKKDPEGRRRQLYIRTYAVVPLNEECGLIEWVLNTTGYRNIIHQLIDSHGGNHKELLEKVKEIYAKHHHHITPQIYREQLLSLYPPIFYKWFLETFPEPSRWFRSRLAYARSAAVMSMVGYIVGLGDRHGENILFDSATGDCIHVDFSCLFFRGLLFEKPEKVPFRLTPNMVDALGLTGYEGVFRRVCEITMRVMRENKETLLSVLETFVYDPLCEWSKSSRSLAQASGEVENEDALQTLKGISDRLNGKKRRPDNVNEILLPLSVEGHVHSLIEDAVSHENLSKMFIGWAPYL